MVAGGGGKASVYKHEAEAVQRPDVGVEAQFANRKAPKTYRYDSSLAPELTWDESGERAFAEWLLTLIADAADNGEAAVFAQPQIWRGTDERFTSLSQCAARLRSLTKPFLNWAGKAERQQVTVPTLPLFVHERHSTQAILDTLKSHKSSGTNLDLFGDIDLDVADKLDAYEHKGPWTNRLVLGDSLQVMNSLLEYEGMGGQVQMIYFDPPYGIKYGSNFQPFVRKRDVKHGPDDHMSREPEMVKAYRDTWELGLHSYLTYLRDRLTLAREMLAESGSVFVQISDENMHHTRELLDDIFGSENFVAQITFQTKIPLRNNYLPGVCDYILWYGKNFSSGLTKFNRLFVGQTLEDSPQFSLVELSDGTIRPIEDAERKGADLPQGAKVFTSLDLASSGRTESCVFDFDWKGKKYSPTAGKSWKTNRQGMNKLAQENRLYATKNALRYKLFFDDYPVQSLTNVWTDSVGVSGKIYVVQTDAKVIARCMLMSSDPGDLVLDITCGSGTTASVAEQWGRRWITVDTSRVPIALARQRLLTTTFPWYRLKSPSHGPAGGFIYERKKNRKGEDIGGLVPHITLGSITNNREPELGPRLIQSQNARAVARATPERKLAASLS